ncbi:MAG: hypothetical protein J1E39_04640 [Eubacterium sp.]|nr:hypothetical protein [Eubacterium sp.]
MSKKNTAATIITIVIAALALATTLFLLYQMSQNEVQQNTPGKFIPSDEVNEEMNQNATRLVKNNCEVFRVFLQYGLPHESEPYNNKPDDGLYTVSSDTYKSMADLETLVKDTFVEKEAERILTNLGDAGAVFADQEDGTLGVNEKCIDKDGNFIGLEYGYSWTNINVTLLPKSNTECDITIELAADDGAGGSATVGSANSSTESTSDESGAGTKTVTVTMMKANGVWLLEKLAY